MSSSVGMMTFPIYGNIKFMFQTTNQIVNNIVNIVNIINIVNIVNIVHIVQYIPLVPI